MLYNTVYSRIFSLLAIVLIIVGYTKFKEISFSNFLEENAGPILSVLPDFTVEKISLNEGQDPQVVTGKSLLEQAEKGLLVHFWATWCAPCEVELPSFIKLSKDLQGHGVSVLLIAINDELPKVNKFLARFKNDIPSNVVFAIDNNSTSSKLLGTVKLPETYLFNKAGLHLKKFVGPQEWDKPYYLDRISNFLK